MKILSEPIKRFFSLYTCLGILSLGFFASSLLDTVEAQSFKHLFKLRNTLLRNQWEAEFFVASSSARFQKMLQRGVIPPGPLGRSGLEIFPTSGEGMSLSKALEFAERSARQLAGREIFFRGLGVKNYTQIPRSLAGDYSVARASQQRLRILNKGNTTSPVSKRIIQKQRDQIEGSLSNILGDPRILKYVEQDGLTIAGARESLIGSLDDDGIVIGLTGILDTKLYGIKNTMHEHMILNTKNISNPMAMRGLPISHVQSITPVGRRSHFQIREALGMTNWGRDKPF